MKGITSFCRSANRSDSTPKMYCKFAINSYLISVLISVIGANVIDYNSYNYYSQLQQAPKQGPLSPSIIFNLLRPSTPNKQKVPAEAATASVPAAISSATSSQSSSPSSSSSGFPGFAAIQSTIQRIPSVQSILDASGVTRLTDPVLNSVRKRWQRIRTR